MGGTIEISEVGMTVNMAGGGKIVIGNWGDGPVNTAAARPPLTPEAVIKLALATDDGELVPIPKSPTESISPEVL